MLVEIIVQVSASEILTVSLTDLHHELGAKLADLQGSHTLGLLLVLFGDNANIVSIWAQKILSQFLISNSLTMP